MNYIVGKKKILDTLMSYKGFSRKTEFALFLEIKPNVLSNWYNRNSFDENILINKFPEISYSWLLTGEGSMLKDSSVINSQNVKSDNNINVNSGSISNSNVSGGNVKVATDSNISKLIDQQSKFLDQQTKLMEQLTESQKHLSNSQRQIDNLIDIISNKLK